MSSRWIVCVVLLAGAVVPANSSAATGDLSYAGCFGSSRAFGCTNAPPGVGAAEEPARTVIAPDGVNAFTVGGNPADPYAGDGLMRLSRAVDGTLSFVSCFTGPACAQFPPWINPMDLPRDLVASPDGEDLYVISEFSSVVAHFRLDAHGDPAFVDCIPCDPGSGAEEADVFGSPMSLAISPDGRHLYVGAGSFGQALLTLDRRSDGSLEVASCNGGSGAPACDPLPGPCAIPLNETCRGYALDSPRAVAVSRDGTRVFVASGNDGEYAPNAISTFRRAADGSLDFLSCLGYATAGCHSTAAWPVVGAQALAVDREGDDLYVGAEAYSERGPRDVVSHLEVAADGTLRVGDCIAHQAVSGCGRLPTGVEALRFVRSISLSPDGGSLYAGAVGSPAITHFRVGPSGALSFAGCVNGLGCTVTSPSTGSTGVTVSPDGRNVYGHAGNTIVVYRREQTAVQPVPSPPPPPPPPAVRTGDADAIGQSAAILSARVNPLGTDTTYAFEVGATDAYGRETEVAPAGAGSERHWVSSRISGLEPGTTYHYRVVATSAAGVSRGADHTFTTEGRPPAAPEGLAPVAEKGPADRAVGYQINSGHRGSSPTRLFAHRSPADGRATSGSSSRTH